MSRREEIITAARKLALQEGVDAVSVRRVAAEVGIGTSTLRYYFPSNRDLFAALSPTTVSDLVNDDGLADTSVPATERLEELLMQFLPISQKQLGALETTLSSYRVAFEGGELIGHEALRSFAQESEQIVTSWLSRLEEEGTQLAIPAPKAAKFLLTIVNGLMLDLITYAPEITVKDAKNQLSTAIALVVDEPER